MLDYSVWKQWRSLHKYTQTFSRRKLVKRLKPSRFGHQKLPKTNWSSRKNRFFLSIYFSPNLFSQRKRTDQPESGRIRCYQGGIVDEIEQGCLQQLTNCHGSAHGQQWNLQSINFQTVDWQGQRIFLINFHFGFDYRIFLTFSWTSNKLHEKGEFRILISGWTKRLENTLLFASWLTFGKTTDPSGIASIRTPSHFSFARYTKNSSSACVRMLLM